MLLLVGSSLAAGILWLFIVLRTPPQARSWITTRNVKSRNVLTDLFGVTKILDEAQYESSIRSTLNLPTNSQTLLGLPLVESPLVPPGTIYFVDPKFIHNFPALLYRSEFDASTDQD